MKKLFTLFICSLLTLSLTTNAHGAQPVSVDYNYYQGNYHQYQWGYFAIQVDSMGKKFTGKGIKVAIVDTGIDGTHPDLYGRVLAGYDFVNNKEIKTNSNSDDQGHGTHVAGIMGAGGLAGGLKGIASNVNFIPVKVLNSQGGGDDDGVAKGVRYAVDNGAQAINLSLGGSSDPFDKSSSKTCESIEYAYNNNVAVFVAAGNSGSIGNNLSDLANCKGSFNVGAVNNELKRSYFSNYDASVDLVAPGSSILSDVPTFNLLPLDSWDGTSMATPFVTGAFALLREAYPNKNLGDLYKLLRSSGVDLGAKGVDSQYGYGLLNIAKLFNKNSLNLEKIKELSLKHQMVEINSINIFDNYTELSLTQPLGVKIKNIEVLNYADGYNVITSNQESCNNLLINAYEIMRNNPEGKSFLGDKLFAQYGDTEVKSTGNILIDLVNQKIRDNCSASTYNIFLQASINPYSNSTTLKPIIKKYTFKGNLLKLKINNDFSNRSLTQIIVYDYKGNQYKSLPFFDYSEKKRAVKEAEDKINSFAANWVNDSILIEYKTSLNGPVRLMVADYSSDYFKYITTSENPFTLNAIDNPEIKSHYLTISISTNSESKNVSLSPLYGLEYKVVTAGSKDVSIKGKSNTCYESKSGCPGDKVVLKSIDGSIIAESIVLDNLSFFFNLQNVNNLKAQVVSGKSYSPILDWSRL